MLDWLTWTQITMSLGAALFCFVLAAIGRAPDDLSVGSLIVVEALLVVQLVVSIVLAVSGNGSRGDGLEFAGYLFTALIVPPAAGLWGLLERSKWSTIILGAAALTNAVLIWRMDQIWFLTA